MSLLAVIITNVVERFGAKLLHQTHFWLGIRLLCRRSELWHRGSGARSCRLQQFFPGSWEFDLPMAGLVKQNKGPDVRQYLPHEIPELVFVRGAILAGPAKRLCDLNCHARALLGRPEHRITEVYRLPQAHAHVRIQSHETKH